jgi:hypothetical protein
MDDDTDTTMDWPADFGCSSASGTSEAFCSIETDPTSLITTTPITGTTTGLTNSFPASSCQATATGADATYALQLPVPVATLVIDLSTSAFDTVLTLRDPQCLAEIACDDDSGTPSGRSKLTLTNVAAGGYSVVVDGYSAANGAFTLAVKGTVAAGTSCTSPLFTGGAAAVLACPTGTSCTGTPARCQ